MNMAMMGDLVGIIAPVFLIAAIGYSWGKLGYDYNTAIITRLLTNVTTPCLVFSRLTSLDLRENGLGALGAAVLRKAGTGRPGVADCAILVLDWRYPS